MPIGSKLPITEEWTCPICGTEHELGSDDRKVCVTCGYEPLPDLPEEDGRPVGIE